MMRYIWDFFKLFSFVLVLYVPVSWYNTTDSIEEIHRQRLAKMAESLEQSSLVVKELLSADQVLEACQTLLAMKRSGAIYIYTLKGPEAACFHPEAMESMPPNLKPNEVRSFIVRGNAVSYVGDQFGNYNWAIAKETPIKKSVWEYIEGYPIIRKGFIKDILTVFFVVCVIVFSGVLIILKPLAAKLKEKGKLPLWVRFLRKTFGRFELHDLKIVRAVTLALKSKTDELQRDLDLLETSLEKSVLNEIRRHSRSVPFSFKGTVAKVDINGYSKVVSESQPSASQDQVFALTQTLEEWGCELLQRYGGLYDKTVGDELVAVFRGEHSELMAFSFVRDLMKEFSNTTFLIGSEKRRFSLKGGIHSSEINFRRRFSGYGFDGLGFVFSTRLMESVSNKLLNVLACTEQDHKVIAPLCAGINLPRKFDFKNMDPVSGYELTSFKTLSEVAEEHIGFFRSDNDIVSLLQQVDPHQDEIRIKWALEALRLIPVKRGSAVITQAWVSSVAAFSNEINLEESNMVNFSGLIMTAKNLIPQNQWTVDCRNVLLGIPRSLNSRLNASIAEILMEKGLSEVVGQYEEEFLSPESDGSFRTQGEVILAEAQTELNNEILRRLIRMLRSHRPLEVSTAVYCSGMVILHYRTKSPAVLESLSNFDTLMKELARAKQRHKLSPRLESLISQVFVQSDNSLDKE